MKDLETRSSSDYFLTPSTTVLAIANPPTSPCTEGGNSRGSLHNALLALVATARRAASVSTSSASVVAALAYGLRVLVVCGRGLRPRGPATGATVIAAFGLGGPLSHQPIVALNYLWR